MMDVDENEPKVEHDSDEELCSRPTRSSDHEDSPALADYKSKEEEWNISTMKEELKEEGTMDDEIYSPRNSDCEQDDDLSGTTHGVEKFLSIIFHTEDDKNIENRIEDSQEKPLKRDISSNSEHEKNGASRKACGKSLCVEGEKKKLFTCDVCGKVFSHRGALISHTIIHSDNNPYKCDICEKKFCKRSTLKDHIRLHTVTEDIKVEVNIKDEPLSDVEMSYDAENNFITVKNEIEETHLEGSAVKEEFDGKMVIEGHQVFLPRYSNIDYLPEDNFSETQQITDIIYATEIKKENKDESLTLEHWNGEKQEMQIQCGVLSSTSKSESFTVESQETENKLLLCHICGKGCRRKHDLERHMRIHPEDRLHKCDTCGKSFIQRNRLICHLYSHTQDQPFKCDICYKEFRCHYGLLVHVRRHSKRDNFSLHTERPQVPYMGEKPFKCEMWQTL
ncbi:zinc finger protein 660-like isoform X1 [Periplaneta americana]|uniref:zinc finger protein 660-like isoform X1 n=1 Tax=Periplaneta americana TaxID=6978 RepID=UPI0037E8CFE9